MKNNNPDIVNIINEIKHFYADNTSSEIETVSIEINNEESLDRFGWCPDPALRQALVWCEWEELPEFVAYLITATHLDLEDILNEIYHEHREEEKEAAEDYYERQQEYQRIQGWNP